MSSSQSSGAARARARTVPRSQQLHMIRERYRRRIRAAEQSRTCARPQSSRFRQPVSRDAARALLTRRGCFDTIASFEIQTC
jgi:hypothetical protein